MPLQFRVIIIAIIGVAVLAVASPLPAQTTLLTPAQLDELVAPVALYPDPLLSQVLAASTYPLELVEASQWLQRTPGLNGVALTNAAGQQNWDPSVQALVVFPDLLKRLTEDIEWTTNLGNAFLEQQAEVMDAVQRMRAKARQAGVLTSTPQQAVTSTAQPGQNVISILPGEPQIIYVPVYDPVWIWGPYVWLPYPRWHYPRHPVIGVIVYGPPIVITEFFPGPWIGWTAWGWYPMWTSHVVLFNAPFIHRYNFNPGRFPIETTSSIWQHNPFHRQGVPYPNRALNEQYRAAARANLTPRPPVAAHPAPVPVPPNNRDRIGNRQIPPSPPPSQNHGAFGNIQNGDAARRQTDRGHQSMGQSRPTAPPRHSEIFSSPAITDLLLVLVLKIQPAWFSTPEAAIEAVLAAAENNETAALLKLFGPDSRDVVLSGDPAQDPKGRAKFAELVHEKLAVQIDSANSDRATFSIGNEDWPFPVPLIRVNGQWRFDTAQGRSEILARRIGANEINVIDVCRGFAEAEFEYALKAHDDSGGLAYASKLSSLYSETAPGTLIPQAFAQADRNPYHGYYFRIIRSQGANAPGGSFNYMVKDRMIGGFALIAFPAEYGVSGIKTFMINHDGIVYEKDLGTASAAIAKALTTFDPDDSWNAVIE
jgi:hypothetical protein